MKPFSERNLFLIGAIGLLVTIGIVVGAVQYDKLPIFQGKEYSGYFAEVGGLTTDDDVQVSGFTVGKVKSIELDGPRVLIKFTVDRKIRLGDRTEAAIKTRGLLGTKMLEVTSRGGGQQDGTIPLDRTTSPYQLPDALGDLATHDQRPEHQPAVGFAAGLVGDVFRNPTAAARSPSTVWRGSRRRSTNATHSCAVC